MTSPAGRPTSPNTYTTPAFVTTTVSPENTATFWPELTEADEMSTLIGASGRSRCVTGTRCPDFGVKPPAAMIKSVRLQLPKTGYIPGLPTSPDTETPEEC